MLEKAARSTSMSFHQNAQTKRTKETVMPTKSEKCSPHFHGTGVQAFHQWESGKDTFLFIFKYLYWYNNYEEFTTTSLKCNGCAQIIFLIYNEIDFESVLGGESGFSVQ